MLWGMGYGGAMGAALFGLSAALGGCGIVGGTVGWVDETQHRTPLDTRLRNTNAKSQIDPSTHAASKKENRFARIHTGHMHALARMAWMCVTMCPTTCPTK